VDDAPDPHAVLSAFGVGGDVTTYVEVAGGWSNRVFRLSGTHGDLAVKQVRNAWGEPRWRDWLAEGWRLELAARAAGVLAPEPVAVPGSGACVAEVARRDAAGTVPVRVHVWVDGAAVPSVPVAPALAHEVGEIVARIHGLRVLPVRPELYDGRAAPTSAEAWPDLVRRARAVDAPWADELDAAETLVHRVTGLLVDGTAATMLSHGDIDQRNLLVTSAGPHLVDWDVVLPVVPRHDLAHAAMAMASWCEAGVARGVVDGYRRVTGAAVELQPTDLGPALASRLGWIRFTADRYADARHAATATRHDAPDVAAMLDDLGRRVAVAERLDAWLAAGAGQ
jgi:fructosamine-3-kinase